MGRKEKRSQERRSRSFFYSRSRSRSPDERSSKRRRRSATASPDEKPARAAAKLLKYAARGDARKVRRLLKKHPAVARAPVDGGHGATTPLHEAARRGFAGLVQLLVR
jgi:hypothetical protein